MDLQLNGKRALVTGSTAGIGFAIAEALAREGASVVINGRQQARVDAACARMRERVADAAVSGITVSGIAADLGTAEGCNQLTRSQGDVDILVWASSILSPSTRSAMWTGSA